MAARHMLCTPCIDMRILLISPFAAERTALQELLHADGHRVTAVESRADGLVAASTEHPDVIIADVQVPGLDGLPLLRELSARGARRVILLCPRANRTIEKNGVVCLTKPIDLAELARYLAQGPVPIARFA